MADQAQRSESPNSDRAFPIAAEAEEKKITLLVELPAWHSKEHAALAKLECWRVGQSREANSTFVALRPENDGDVIAQHQLYIPGKQESFFFSLKLEYPRRWGTNDAEILRYKFTLPELHPALEEVQLRVELPELDVELRDVPCDEFRIELMCQGKEVHPRKASVLLPEVNDGTPVESEWSYSYKSKPIGLQYGDQVLPYRESSHLRTDFKWSKSVAALWPNEGEWTLYLQGYRGVGVIELPAVIQADLRDLAAWQRHLSCEVTHENFVAELGFELDGNESISLPAPRGHVDLSLELWNDQARCGYLESFECGEEALTWSVPEPESLPGIHTHSPAASESASENPCYVEWNFFHEDYESAKVNQHGEVLHWDRNLASGSSYLVHLNFKPGRWIAIAEAESVQVAGGDLAFIEFTMSERGAVELFLPQMMERRDWNREEVIKPGLTLASLAVEMPDEVKRAMALGMYVDLEFYHTFRDNVVAFESHTRSTERWHSFLTGWWNEPYDSYYSADCFHAADLPWGEEIEVTIAFVIENPSIDYGGRGIRFGDDYPPFYYRRYSASFTFTPQWGEPFKPVIAWDVQEAE